MLDFLLGDVFKEMFSTIAIIAAVFIFLYFFSKFKPIQALTGCVVFLALIVSAIFSFGHLNNYYNASGGIIGEITSLFQKNQVDITEEEDKIKFDFKNVVLMKNAKGKYSASMTTDKVLNLDDDENYFMYVNNDPCTTVQCEVRDIYANYSYVFMDRESGEYKVIADDVMTFYFALYDNYSYLYIEVDDGEYTAGLWNSYFNKNDFKVTIVKVSESMYSSSDYKTISLFANNTLYKKIKLLKGTDYILPETIDLDGYMLNSWVDSQGNNISEVSDISENMIIKADLIWLTYSMQQIDPGIEVESSLIWNDGNNTYYSAGSEQYKFNASTMAWEENTWNGLTNFYGSMIWNINDDCYYSYDSQQYKLNKSNNTWEIVAWTGLTSFNGNYVWSDGDNIYYSHNSSYSVFLDDSPEGNYKLNTSTNTWQAIPWNGFDELDATCIWIDNENCYFSYGEEQYILNKETQSWDALTWNNLTPSDRGFIWSNGNLTFYSQGSNQYILAKGNTWTKTNWLNNDYPNGKQVWSDGSNYYYSSGFSTYKITI